MAAIWQPCMRSRRLVKERPRPLPRTEEVRQRPKQNLLPPRERDRAKVGMDQRPRQRRTAGVERQGL